MLVVRAICGSCAVILVATSLGAQPVRLVSRASSGSSASADHESAVGDYALDQPDPRHRRVLSRDSRFLVFSSLAHNLVVGQASSGSWSSVFRYDRLTETTILVSHRHDSPLVGGNGGSSRPLMSEDGCVVAFESTSTDLIPGYSGPPSAPQVFVYDCATENVSLASHAFGSTIAGSNGYAGLADISADGKFILFSSNADDLIAGSNVQGYNLYARDRSNGQAQLVTRTATSATTSANAGATFSRMSGDGRFVAFASTASDLVTGFVQPGVLRANIYLHHAVTGITTLVSSQSGSTTTAADGDSGALAVNIDGRFVAFASFAGNLVPGQVDGATARSDVFLHDRMAGSTLLVSRESGSTFVATNQDSHSPSISDDGARVVFASNALNLLSGFVDGNFPELPDVFLFDRSSGTNVLVSHRADNPLASGNQEARAAVVSGDGNSVLFTSAASDLVAGQIDANGAGYDAFRFDSGSLRLLSRTSASSNQTGNGSLSGGFGLSADGRFAAFGSYATDLVAGDLNGAPDVFLFGPAAPMKFFTVVPCRAVDTRSTQGPALTGGASREFVLRGVCGIPATAEAVAVNVTVVGPTQAGFLNLFSAGQIPPLASQINFSTGQVRANNSVVSPGTAGKASILAGMPSGQVDVLVDVVGYFQ